MPRAVVGGIPLFQPSRIPKVGARRPTESELYFSPDLWCPADILDNKVGQDCAALRGICLVLSILHLLTPFSQLHRRCPLKGSVSDGKHRLRTSFSKEAEAQISKCSAKPSEIPRQRILLRINDPQIHVTESSEVELHIESFEIVNIATSPDKALSIGWPAVNEKAVSEKIFEYKQLKAKEVGTPAPNGSPLSVRSQAGYDPTRTDGAIGHEEEEVSQQEFLTQPPADTRLHQPTWTKDGGPSRTLLELLRARGQAKKAVVDTDRKSTPSADLGNGSVPAPIRKIVKASPGPVATDGSSDLTPERDANIKLPGATPSRPTSLPACSYTPRKTENRSIERHESEDNDISTQANTEQTDKVVSPDTSRISNHLEQVIAPPLPDTVVQRFRRWRQESQKYLPRYIQKIPREQQKLLESDESWQPPLVGRPERPGQVPLSLLEELSNAADNVVENELLRSRNEDQHETIDRAHDQETVKVNGNEQDHSNDSDDSEVTWDLSPPTQQRRQQRPAPLPPNSPPVDLLQPKEPIHPENSDRSTENQSPEQSPLSARAIVHAHQNSQIHIFSNPGDQSYNSTAISNAPIEQESNSSMSSIAPNTASEQYVREDRGGTGSIQCPIPSTAFEHPASSGAKHVQVQKTPSPRKEPHSRDLLSAQAIYRSSKAMVDDGDPVSIPGRLSQNDMNTIPDQTVEGPKMTREQNSRTTNSIVVKYHDRARSPPVEGPHGNINHAVNPPNKPNLGATASSDAQDFRLPLTTGGLPQSSTTEELHSDTRQPVKPVLNVENGPLDTVSFPIVLNERSEQVGSMTGIAQRGPPLSDTHPLRSNSEYLGKRTNRAENSHPRKRQRMTSDGETFQNHRQALSNSTGPEVSGRHSSSSSMKDADSINVGPEKSAHTPITRVSTYDGIEDDDNIRPSDSVSTTSDSVDAEKLFSSFQIAYPDYDGTTNQFITSCQFLKDLLSKGQEHHPFLFDDMIFHHHHSFRPYLMEEGMIATVPLLFSEFYRQRITKPTHLEGIVTESALKKLPNRTPSTVSGINNSKRHPNTDSSTFARPITVREESKNGSNCRSWDQFHAENDLYAHSDNGVENCGPRASGMPSPELGTPNIDRSLSDINPLDISPNDTPIFVSTMKETVSRSQERIPPRTQKWQNSQPRQESSTESPMTRVQKRPRPSASPFVRPPKSTPTSAPKPNPDVLRLESPNSSSLGTSPFAKLRKRISDALQRESTAAGSAVIARYHEREKEKEIRPAFELFAEDYSLLNSEKLARVGTTSKRSGGGINIFSWRT
ncbi:uncharacterized protein Z518_05081 [Rhinocladiella mackenziei CBS 650.93]|uniref:Telomere replication protein EST3 n=1 Tax=Rhinocladiella mackenziei CBS 650.93 TaxID=1442369 RepID=A0A0D2IMU7_9EURO|nr:uncharacterized protein Z518_05081 [Rhinocladiella mackenziei CBS 650.93]KIX07104.1 hypothetical protein Z518_05081 [Rhinocladiella mackenziei CBS 650.93]